MTHTLTEITEITEEKQTIIGIPLEDIETFKITTSKHNPTPYVPLNIDEENLTINGVQFPSLKELKYTAAGITSNMYEGWRPTPKMIEITRDYSLGKISLSELIEIVKNGQYE